MPARAKTPPMAATPIDGKALAARTRAALAATVAPLAYRPHLAVVLASEDPASAIYVRNKSKAAHEVGIESTQHVLPPSTTREELLALIARLNADAAVDGILVQLPLPPQHDAQEVIAAIDPHKDVDGFHPLNAGRLARGDESGLVSCTPLGVIRLLEDARTTIPGARAVVLGRSNIVGRPVAELLLNRSATVTVCHSRTVDLPARIAEADIVVAAIGKPELVQGAWIKEGATVIDVGINKRADGKVVGDVDFAGASLRARAITPVPGGAGPMTIACLLENTVKAAALRRAPTQGAR